MQQTVIPDDVAEQHLRMIEIAFKRGEKDRALAAVEKAFQTAREISQVGLLTSLASIVSVRLANTLESIGIYTIADVLQSTESELLLIANVSQTSLSHLRDKLRANGFEWSHEEDWDEEDYV